MGSIESRGFAGYFSFHGFARRLQFWTVFFAATGALMLANAIMVAIGVVNIGVFIASLPIAWLWVATAARRARDAGISPWWAALMLIPLVSLIMMIVLGSMRSVVR
jgi:uncharacterized membrane protein YhaH (DUF805 family)